MRKQDQDSFEGRPTRAGKYVSLASMSVLVVIIGLLLTVALPRILPGDAETAAAPAPTAGPDVTPAATPPIQQDLPTPTPAAPPKVYVLALDTGGRLTEDVRVISEDRQAVLSLAKGTTVTDAQGHHLSSVTVTVRRLTQRLDIGYVGSSYDFGPQGATLDHPASLTISYNPTAYYPFQVETADPSRVYLTYLGEDGSPIRPGLANIDREAASVTAQVDSLQTFVLYCLFFRPPYPPFM